MVKSNVLVIGVKYLKKLVEKKIKNKYDCNIIVTGKTGVGKSTFIYQFLKRFRGFKIEDKLTYSRDETIHLIRDFKESYVWNDELISSAFKRTWFEGGQNLLIKVLTKYRDHRNIVIGAIPIFFTMDKELIKLFRVHIQILKRGLAILHVALEGRQYSDDLWDVKHNKILEERWSKKKEKNPNFKIPYHKYSTFRAYIRFAPLKPKDEEYYEELKSKKRAEAEAPSDKESEKENFYEKILNMVKDGKLDGNELLKICQFNDKSFSSVKTRLGQMLRDEGDGKTLRNFLKDSGRKNDSINSYNNNTPPPSDVGVNDL